MKIKSLFTLCVLCGLLVLSMTSCEEADTRPPYITVVSPQEDATIETGKELCIQVTFLDNMALRSYKINIHPNFNGHTHAPAREEAYERTMNQSQQTVDFEITLTSESQNDPLSGQECFRDIDIDIPADATPGNYHLLIYCTDAAGNETYYARDLTLVNPA